MGRELNPNIKVEPPTPEMPNISPPEKFDLIKLESEQIAQSKIVDVTGESTLQNARSST